MRVVIWKLNYFGAFGFKIPTIAANTNLLFDCTKFYVIKVPAKFKGNYLRAS